MVETPLRQFSPITPSHRPLSQHQLQGLVNRMPFHRSPVSFPILQAKRAFQDGRGANRGVEENGTTTSTLYNYLILLF
jgi:hypothetical protein